MMNKKEERELFLRYLAKIYSENPQLPISSDTIYYELTKFVVNKNRQCTLGSNSLLSIQLGLINKYKNNEGINTFMSRDGYFLVIEKRMGEVDSKFYSDIKNGAKLYISVDLSSTYLILDQLFSFIIKERIIMQSKVAKELRNDAIVCRVTTTEDAKKIINYLNGLDYKPGIKPNPFVLSSGKVSVTKDGTLSYNAIISYILEAYLSFRRHSNSLTKVSTADLNNFIKSQIQLLKESQSTYLMNLYKIYNEENFNDFIMISHFISGNLEDSLTLEEIFEYNREALFASKEKYSKKDERNVLYVINSLAGYYGVESVHKIIMKYIETGDLNLFTRRAGIRSIVRDNFSPEDIKRIVSDLGFRAFVFASEVTYDKYGKEQLLEAIEEYLSEEKIVGFTRDNEARGRLGLIIPSELLKEVLASKLKERKETISAKAILNLVLERMKKDKITVRR